MNPTYEQVYTAYGHLEAETIRIFLESFGIPVRTTQEAAGQVYGLTVGSLGKVVIWVPADLVQEANDLLTEMHSGELIEPDNENTGEEEPQEPVD